MNKEQYKLFIANIVKDALVFLDDTPFKLNAHCKKKALEVLKVCDGEKGTSKGGTNTITIKINGWQKRNVIAGEALNQHDKFKTDKYKKDGYVYVCEYRSFSDDPKCGGMFVKNGNVDHANLITVLHEVAHFAQHNLRRLDRRKYPHMRKPHGDGFKQIYTRLREKFCNDDVVRNNYINKWKII